MKVLVALALVGLSVGCASGAAPVATVAQNGNAACRDDHARDRKQRELALRKQRMRQYHARGLSPPENEAALERDLEAARTACLPVQHVDEPAQAAGPVQPLAPAVDPVQSADEP